MPQPKLSRDNSNRVTIRVWSSSIKAGEVGHASLETYGPSAIYASFWPESGVTFSDTRRRARHNTLADDERSEGRPADVTIRLYSLNVDIINREYVRFKESGCDWDLWASSIFHKENTRNCCGLAYHLLKLGGIHDLVEEYPSFPIALTIGLVSATAVINPVAPIAGAFAWAAMKGARYVAPPKKEPFPVAQGIAYAINHLGYAVDWISAGIVLTPTLLGEIAKAAKRAEPRQYEYCETPGYSPH
jgi:hypothetical protein